MNMKLKIGLIVVGIVAIMGIIIVNNHIVEEPVAENPVVKINAEDDFSLKFLKLENNGKNLIYSPLSIKYALKMLSEGSSGNTKTQIDSLIGNLNFAKYNNIDKVLSFANGIYIRDTFSKDIKESYKNTLAEKYNAEVKYDSFKDAKNINKWIEDKTLGIVKNMLEDDAVQNPDMMMTLINALAIDMEWKNSFDAKDTVGKGFYLENGTKIITTTMNKKASGDDVSYYKDQDITALSMDLKQYDNTQLEFIAIMPEEKLSNYITNFNIDDLNNIINKFTLASNTNNGVKVSIPKFSFEYNLKLKYDLINLGIIDAFENLADFSKISDIDMCVGDALHKAKIDFTEKGIKAAAVTVILMKKNSMPMEDKPVEINIDKPFLYFIKDKNTNEIWFVGTVYEPNLWENDMNDYKM